MSSKPANKTSKQKKHTLGFIKDPKVRNDSFKKRHKGLESKINKLHELTHANVAMVIVSEDGKKYFYTTQDLIGFWNNPNVGNILDNKLFKKPLLQEDQPKIIQNTCSTESERNMVKSIDIEEQIQHFTKSDDQLQKLISESKQIEEEDDSEESEDI